MQPLEDDAQVGGVVVEVMVVHGQKSANIYQRILLCAHRAAVGVGAEFLDDGGDGTVLAAGLAILNEVSVFDHARSIQDHADSVLVRQFADRLHIGERNRLAAGQVHRGGDAEVGNVSGAVSLDDLFHLVQVHVAFEGVQVLRVMRLGNDDVYKGAAGQLLVKTGSGEVHVAGNNVARLDKGLRQQVLSAAALVRRDNVLVSIPVAHRLFQPVKAAAAGVGLVAHHHRRPLPVAHGRGSGVGQQVNVHIFTAQQKGIVACLADCLFQLRMAGNPHRFHHFDLERLCPCALLHCHLVHSSFPRRNASFLERLQRTIRA